MIFYWFEAMTNVTFGREQKHRSLRELADKLDKNLPHIVYTYEIKYTTYEYDQDCCYLLQVLWGCKYLHRSSWLYGVHILCKSA